MGKGVSFGELALLSQKPRSATITCITDTVLAYLTTAQYKKILGAVESKRLQEVIEFFQHFSFLKHMSPQLISKTYLTFKVQTLRNGNYVYKEGEKSKGIYLILEGSFEICKNIVVVDEPYDPRFGLISKMPKKSKNVRIMTLDRGESFGLAESFK